MCILFCDEQNTQNLPPKSPNYANYDTNLSTSRNLIKFFLELEIDMVH